MVFSKTERFTLSFGTMLWRQHSIENSGYFINLACICRTLKWYELMWNIWENSYSILPNSSNCPLHYQQMSPEFKGSCRLFSMQSVAQRLHYTHRFVFNSLHKKQDLKPSVKSFMIISRSFKCPARWRFESTMGPVLSDQPNVCLLYSKLGKLLLTCWTVINGNNI